MGYPHRPILSRVTQVSVLAASSTAVVAANPNRVRLLIKNVGATNFAWVDPAGGTASATNGYKLALNGELEIFGGLAVTARADTGNVTFCIVEEYN